MCAKATTRRRVSFEIEAVRYPLLLTHVMVSPLLIVTSFGSKTSWPESEPSLTVGPASAGAAAIVAARAEAVATSDEN